MERLRQKDVRDGVDHPPRTDEQKAAIADIRSLYDAKIAQAEVMHRSAVVGILDEDARVRVDEEYQRDRARLQAERDARIEKIRGSGGN
jgi:LPS O-antigen subunit length determinant protein (WzzB/FepE family)